MTPGQPSTSVRSKNTNDVRQGVRMTPGQPIARPLKAELLTAAALVAAPFVLPYLGAAPDTVNRVLVWGLFGIGFDMLFGYTGLLSFGQSALYGTGGMVAAYLLTRAGFSSVVLALLIGTVVAAVVGDPWD